MTEEREKELQKKSVDELNKAFDDCDESNFKYLRNLTTLATGLLGLLVSLKSDEAISINSKYLFILTIMLLAFGILFSMITQYEEVYYKNKDLENKMFSFRKKNYKKESWELISMDNNDKYKPPTKVFVRTKKISYVCLSLAFISLIIYVIFIEFSL
ncbi:hypothetical protein [Flavobacterium muglaense]|uniref:Uncharacterized protein n=1 Tax=Flavobacterium muglaense TaxID=2764716 RepID=A0A923MWW5_9FLAO|nr:hypothetical protein [Flavobacterium muglaense]MBC5836804.1 hypothetical protein [Flavobacterium muglaense]MBC5843246.1 hypothetical protein [Flavobacterium muglaense]